MANVDTNTCLMKSQIIP